MLTRFLIEFYVQKDIIITLLKNKHLETPAARTFILLLMRFSYRLELLQAECCHYK